MADTTTANYGWVKPEVGGSDDTWGTKLNGNWDDADTKVAELEGEIDSNTAHAADTSNPHNVTKSQVGLSNVDNVKQAPDTHRVPSGAILMWSGSVASIPTGWALCNGANGTPDLRNRFVIGAGDSYAVGATGGATSETTDSKTTSLTVNGHTLTLSQIPSHDHGGGNHGHSITLADQGGDEPHNGSGYGSSGASVPGGGTSNDGSAINNSGNVVNNEGGGGSHSHGVTDPGHSHSVSTMSPYYALAYIMKT